MMYIMYYKYYTKFVIIYLHRKNLKTRKKQNKLFSKLPKILHELLFYNQKKVNKHDFE